MHRFPLRRLPLAYLVLVAVSLLSASSARSQDSSELRYHRYYFKTPQALTFDLSRLAVMDRSTQPQNEKPSLSAALKESLRRHEVPDEQVVPLFRNFSLAAVPEGKRGSVDSVKSLLRSLKNDYAHAFVSPVFLSEEGNGPLVVTDLIFLRFNPETTEEEAQAILNSIDAEEEVTEASRDGGRANTGIHALRCRTRDGFEVLAIANQLAQNPLVCFAEPNLIARAKPHSTVSSSPVFPGDPFFNNQWGLYSNTSPIADVWAPWAWRYTTGNLAVKVAVMGLGVYVYKDPFGPLDINVYPGYTTINAQTTPGGAPDDNDVNPDSKFHDTKVAGIISAVMNDKGTVGIAPNCAVVPFRCFNDNGVYDILSVGRALIKAEAIGCRITNLSWGIATSPTVTTVYEQTRGRGMIHFASSGNGNQEFLAFPAGVRA